MNTKKIFVWRKKSMKLKGHQLEKMSQCKPHSTRTRPASHHAASWNWNCQARRKIGRRSQPPRARAVSKSTQPASSGTRQRS